jgi:glycosyltransferase involved in cell wall biosynthesis
MRVLIATSTFPLSDDDGLPRFVYDLARAMSAFCTVTVLAPHHGGAPLEASMGRLTVKRFRYAWPASVRPLAYGSGMRENMKASRTAGFQVPAYMAALTMAVRKLSLGRRYDVVNSHWLVPQGLGVALACGRKQSSAHVASVHAGDVSLLETLPTGKQITRFIARRTDLFLPVSSPLGERLQKLAGTGVRWAAQPMGVDFERFSRPLDRLPAPLPFSGHFILFVGRMVAKKGVAGLLEAMARLAPEFPELGLVLIGSGPLEGALKARARMLGLGPRVSFLGRRGHADIRAYMHACTVLAVPSIVDPRGETEGMPTVLAEALAAGCRVVAGRVDGIIDWIVDGCNGWLARPGDSGDLARRMREALMFQGAGIKTAARETARRLDWSRVAESYLNHFESVLKRGGSTDGSKS